MWTTVEWGSSAGQLSCPMKQNTPIGATDIEAPQHPSDGASSRRCTAPRYLRRTTLLARLGVVLAALALALGMSLVGASNAVAEPSSAPLAPVAWQPNGCTWTPDWAFGVSFKAACDQHDRRYHYHWAGDGLGGH